MARRLTRLFGLLVLVDGGLSAALGHRFLHRLQAITPPMLHGLIRPFERIPEPAFRAAAVLQAAAGAHLLYHGGIRPGRKASHG